MALVVASITALRLVPNEYHDEYLKSAINAVTRKKRSLDQASQDYYNELHSFKYHDRPLEDKNDELEFLPNENGQLEMVGDGYQGVNNKLLEKSVIDYLENAQEQERVPSIFRERERSSSRKRGNGNIENTNIDGRELAKLFLEELQDDSPPYSQIEVEENYMDGPIYDRYRNNQGNNKIYDNEGPMSWSELFDKGDLLLGETRSPGDENDFVDKDTEQSVVYFLPTERRNVNARFPLGRELENYRALGKRYPVAKRSPKEFQQMKREITDPKVAQDLGALFGTQSTLDSRNYTRPHEHDHNHEHNHDHEHARITDTSEAPKVTPAPKGQKENATKISKSKGKAIEVKKKSVDWSQYFGIDRRKKKATFLARPGTQDQDDEWMLQRYYESMAENLKPPERESENEKDERKEKVEQIYPRLNNIDLDLEKAKDQIMNRLATAYSMEKMRKALNELRISVNPHLEVLKAVHPSSNSTQNFRNNESAQRSEKKRTSSSKLDTNEVFDENKNCPELEAIERHCKIADNLAGDGGQMLYLACVMLQMCKACVPNEMETVCLARYAIEANKVCDAQNERGGVVEHEYCVSTALNLLQFQPSIANSMQCRLNRDDKISTCLHRYQYRYRHRYPHYPSHVGYFSHGGYETSASQASDR